MSAAPAVLAAPRPPAVARGRARGRLLVLLCAFYALSYFDRTNISTAAPAIRSALGLSQAEMGVVFSAFSLPYAFLQVFGGWLGDRAGARRTMAALALVWAGATAMTGLAGGFVVLVVARALLGTGESAGFPTATSAMSRWLPASLRGQGQGYVHAASRLATAVAPLVVAALISASSWRVSFLVVAAASAVWAVVWWVWFRDDPRAHPGVTAEEVRELDDGDAAGPTSRRAAGRTPWRLVAPALLPVAFVDFCYGWLAWVYLTWLPSVFSSVFHLPLKGFALFTSLVLVAGVLGDVVGGRAADQLAARRSLRWARRLPLVVGLGGSLLALLPGLLHPSLVVTTVSLAVAFFLLEGTNSTLWALPMDVAPEHAGAASGFMNTGFGLAGVASPALFGWLLQTSGDWRVPMAVAVALLAAGALVALRIDPQRRTAPAAVAAPVR